MTTKGELRDRAAQLLVGQTDAGSRVFTPSDWPTWDNLYPVIQLSAPTEEKQPSGLRGTIEFTVVATIRIVAKVQALAQPADAGAELAEIALERLELQILRQLINSPHFMGRDISSFPFVRSQIAMSAEGREHIAESVIDLGVEFYQGPEEFYDIDRDAVPLQMITITQPEPAGTRQVSIQVVLPQDTESV